MSSARLKKPCCAQERNAQKSWRSWPGGIRGLSLSSRSRYRDVHTEERSYFICCNCGRYINPAFINPSHRNHCPHCLWSLHVDLRPGDRMSFCRGKMQPVAIWVKDNGEWSLLHRCTTCGVIKPNRIAADDNEELLYEMAIKLLEQFKTFDVKHPNRS